MLEPLFGETGAVVALWLLIFLLLLGVIGLGYWAFRQYGGAAFGGSNKGRVPRLGVIDSLSIDHRHRLVLVRRDNVEHLILIGKTTDLVVEPSIARAVPAGGRSRQAQAPRPQQQAQAPRPQPQKRAVEANPRPPAVAAAGKTNRRRRPRPREWKTPGFLNQFPSHKVGGSNRNRRRKPL